MFTFGYEVTVRYVFYMEFKNSFQIHIRNLLFLLVTQDRLIP